MVLAKMVDGGYMVGSGELLLRTAGWPSNIAGLCIMGLQ